MASVSQASATEHPLLENRERLDEILDVMYAKIHKTLFGKRGRRSENKLERILVGSAVSADDVLSEALLGLFQYPPERLEGTWEALAVSIAGYKAIDALKASNKGLRGTDHRPQMYLVSGDAERDGRDGTTEPALFESLPSDWGDAETEYFMLRNLLQLRDLARKALSDQDQEIFFEIHFRICSRKEVGERLGLTSQRIGQIYDAALRTLEAHPDYPFK